MSRKKTIRELRKEQGLTQAELGELLGCTQTCVGNWENGQRTPSLKMAGRIADTFGVRMDEIDFFCPQILRNELKRGA